MATFLCLLAVCRPLISVSHLSMATAGTGILWKGLAWFLGLGRDKPAEPDDFIFSPVTSTCKKAPASLEESAGVVGGTGCDPLGSHVVRL